MYEDFLEYKKHWDESDIDVNSPHERNTELYFLYNNLSIDSEGEENVYSLTFKHEDGTCVTLIDSSTCDEGSKLKYMVDGFTRSKMFKTAYKSWIETERRNLKITNLING